MKKITLLVLMFLMASLIYAQNNDTIYKTFDDTDDLKRLMQEDEVEIYKYLDTTFKYQIDIPEWLFLRETGSYVLGGTLPAIDGIENALVINAYYKEQVGTFEDFKHIFLTGNKFGSPTLFSNDHIWYGRKELIEIENGVRQKVFTLWNGLVYHNEFVLLETPTAFLWINFVATPDTYNINIGKLDEFLSNLKIFK